MVSVLIYLDGVPKPLMDYALTNYHKQIKYLTLLNQANPQIQLLKQS